MSKVLVKLLNDGCYSGMENFDYEAILPATRWLNSPLYDVSYEDLIANGADPEEFTAGWTYSFKVEVECVIVENDHE